jgi:hypothetical protein
MPLRNGAMWVAVMPSSGSLSATVLSGSGFSPGIRPGRLGSATD